MPQHLKYIQSLSRVHSVRSLVESGHVYQQLHKHWQNDLTAQAKSFRGLAEIGDAGIKVIELKESVTTPVNSLEASLILVA
jgi:hypothetical protein